MPLAFAAQQENVCGGCRSIKTQAVWRTYRYAFVERQVRRNRGVDAGRIALTFTAHRIKHVSSKHKASNSMAQSAPCVLFYVSPHTSCSQDMFPGGAWGTKFKVCSSRKRFRETCDNGILPICSVRGAFARRSDRSAETVEKESPSPPSCTPAAAGGGDDGLVVLLTVVGRLGGVRMTFLSKCKRCGYRRDVGGRVGTSARGICPSSIWKNAKPIFSLSITDRGKGFSAPFGSNSMAAAPASTSGVKSEVSCAGGVLERGEVDGTVWPIIIIFPEILKSLKTKLLFVSVAAPEK